MASTLCSSWSNSPEEGLDSASCSSTGPDELDADTCRWRFLWRSRKSLRTKVRLQPAKSQLKSSFGLSASRSVGEAGSYHGAALTVQLMSLEMLCSRIGFAAALMLTTEPSAGVGTSPGGLLLWELTLTILGFGARCTGRSCREGVKMARTCCLHVNSSGKHCGEMSGKHSAQLDVAGAAVRLLGENWKGAELAGRGDGSHGGC